MVFSQWIACTCILGCLTTRTDSLGTPFDDEDVNEHHLRTDFRLTGSSAQLPQHKALSPVPQCIRSQLIAALTHRHLWEDQMMTTSLEVRPLETGVDEQRLETDTGCCMS